MSKDYDKKDIKPADAVVQKEFKPEKLSKVRTRLFLWRQNILDIVRRHKAKQNKQEHKSSGKESTQVEREKLYNQFVNRLIILLVNGIAVGALLLAALDYIANAQIPERSPVLLTFFLVVTLYCTVYWYFTYKKGKGIEGLRGLAVFALILSILGSTAGVYDVYTNNKNLNTYFHGERIAIKNQQETSLVLASYIDTWRHTPNYSLVHISDHAYYAVVYNSKGESLSQLVTLNDGADTDTEDAEEKDPTQNMTVVLKDGTAVIATETAVERRRDADNLKYVEVALQWAAEGKARLDRYSVATDAISKDTVPLEGLPGTEYTVTISGLDQIMEFYSSIIGKTAAHDLFHALETIDGQIDLVFQMALDSSYIGVAAEINVAGQENLLWYIDNYIAAYDWELGTHDWYNYDYKDPEKNERMLQTALFNASSMLQRLGEDLGAPVE